MKANEAPEKIYLDIEPNLDDCTWHLTNPNGDSIEYIRTDAFVEKVWNWIEDNLLSSNQQDKSRFYYEQFKKYMEGE